MHLVATRSGNVPLKQMLALPADQCTLTSPVGEKKHINFMTKRIQRVKKYYRQLIAEK